MSRTDFNDTGNYYMHTSVAYGEEYEGNTIRLKLKTSTTTMHECDVDGDFYGDV